MTSILRSPEGANVFVRDTLSCVHVVCVLLFFKIFSLHISSILHFDRLNGNVQGQVGEGNSE